VLFKSQNMTLSMELEGVAITADPTLCPKNMEFNVTPRQKMCCGYALSYDAGILYLSANYWLCRKPRIEQRCSSGVRLAHNNTWGTYTRGMMGVNNSYPLLKTSLLRDPAIGKFDSQDF
jgi:hypothetical protein